MTCKEVDLNGIVAKAESDIKKDGKPVEPLILATYCWTPIAYFDLRDLKPGCRVREAKRMVQKEFDLESEGFKYKTKIKNVPTKEQAANRITYITTLEKDYAAANGQRCCPPIMAGPLRDMLARFDDLYTALEGLANLDRAQNEGLIIQWAKVYGTAGAPYGPLQIGWDWEALIRSAKMPSSKDVRATQPDHLKLVYIKAKSDSKFADDVYIDPYNACKTAGIEVSRTEIRIIGGAAEEARKYFVERLNAVAQHTGKTT